MNISGLNGIAVTNSLKIFRIAFDLILVFPLVIDIDRSVLYDRYYVPFAVIRAGVIEMDLMFDEL